MEKEVERRSELAAAIGLDPQKLWPGNSGRYTWSHVEVDAYLDSALFLSGFQHGPAPGGRAARAAAARRQVTAPESRRSKSGRRPAAQAKMTSERALSALGAAGSFLLTDERAESERLESLRETNMLHSGAEETFDRVVFAARKYFDVGAASLSLIAEDAQYFKSVVGPLREETPRQIALCAATVEQNSMLIINDTLTDGRFASNPLVTGAPYIRFYAGYPLHGPRGWNIGTLCIIDQKPRPFPPADQQVLRTLAAVVQKHIDART